MIVYGIKQAYGPLENGTVRIIDRRGRGQYVIEISGHEPMFDKLVGEFIDYCKFMQVEKESKW